MIQSNDSLYSGNNMLVVIDPSTADYERIATKVSAEASVIVLNPDSDAIAQISTALHCFNKPFSSIHIIVDCSPGILHFTSGNFSFKTLKSNVDRLQSWFAKRASNLELQGPRLFIYGHRFTTGQVGEQFADTLAWLTGATISTATAWVAGEHWTTAELKASESIFGSAV